MDLESQYDAALLQVRQMRSVPVLLYVLELAQDQLVEAMRDGWRVTPRADRQFAELLTRPHVIE